MAGDRSANMRVLIALGIIGLFGIITFALAAATLGTLNRRYDNLNQQINVLLERIATLDSKLPTGTTTATVTPGPSTIASNTPSVTTPAASTIASNTPSVTTPAASTIASSTPSANTAESTVTTDTSPAIGNSTAP